MLFDELLPLFKVSTGQPIAFLGGFCAGVLQLDPEEDPLKSWLARAIPDQGE
ncbi:MAG: hypothetical protein AAFY11_01005 [Cyanobacteria bacterium J06641_5]